MNRRDFITLLSGAGVAWPFTARAQQPGMPIMGFVSNRSAEASVRQTAAFRKGLSETGYVEGQNVMVEYHWLEGQYNRLPPLMADLVRRRVAVIATFANPPALAAKAATSTIPIVFGVGQDPVRMAHAALARGGAGSQSHRSVCQSDRCRELSIDTTGGRVHHAAQQRCSVAALSALNEVSTRINLAEGFHSQDP